MQKLLRLSVLLFSGIIWSQTFIGSNGNISDDGATNVFTANVSGLPASGLAAANGLVQVCLNVTHTYDSDLNVHLIAPDGTEINLFSALGGGDDNFTNTCLSQSATTTINAGAAPFSGTFLPQETLGNINNGQVGNGVWTLSIIDTYPDADTGSVISWSIQFGPNAATPFVFTSSNLPIVILNTNGVTIPDEPKIDAMMGIIYNGVGATNSITDAPNNYNGKIGIEMRGNFSQGLPQKPYKLELRDAANDAQDQSILGMPEESDWCLIANYNDKVFMRNALPYKIFTEMGHYAPRSQYCEVVLNGSYQGIYLFMESIKRDNERVDIAKLETTENTGINVTGGYIIKNDYWNWDDSWQLNYHPIDHPNLDVHLVYDYPKPENITSQQEAYIQDFINDFETALYSPNFANETTGYNAYIDKQSFIDYFIVNEVARNNDGFKKSAFFNKDIDSPNAISKLKAGPVWDFDWAWKNIWGCDIFSATDGSGWAHHINDCSPDVNSPGWYIRLLQDSQFRDDLRCRWESLRANVLSDAALDNYIDTTALYLDGAQQRHFNKWGNLGVNTGAPEVEYDAATFPLQITRFKEWIVQRITWLDANIPGDATNCSLATNENIGTTISIYPNPVLDRVHINTAETIENVSLIDIAGRETPLKVVEHVINLSEWPTGTYLLRIIMAGKTPAIFRIVKQ